MCQLSLSVSRTGDTVTCASSLSLSHRHSPFAMLYYAMLHYVMLRFTVLRYAILCYTTLGYAILHHAMPCYAILRCDMLYSAMLCYIMLCYLMISICGVAGPRMLVLVAFPSSPPHPQRWTLPIAGRLYTKWSAHIPSTYSVVRNP